VADADDRAMFDGIDKESRQPRLPCRALTDAARASGHEPRVALIRVRRQLIAVGLVDPEAQRRIRPPQERRERIRHFAMLREPIAPRLPALEYSHDAHDTIPAR